MQKINLKDLSYDKKRKLVLAIVATILSIITILGCVLLVSLSFGESLHATSSVQQKKADSYAEAASSTPKEGVVFVGDSIFEMFNLDKFFKDKGYINRGIAGNKSEDVLKRLQTNVIDLNPKVVILHVGVNDIGHDIPTNEYIKNMYKIINELKTKLNDTTIFVDSIYPTITLNNFNSKNLTKKRDNVTINNVNDKLKNLCNTLNVEFINTHNGLLWGDKLRQDYTIDGLHLSSFGYSKVSQLINPHIISALDTHENTKNQNK